MTIRRLNETVDGFIPEDVREMHNRLADAVDDQYKREQDLLRVVLSRFGELGEWDIVREVFRIRLTTVFKKADDDHS